MYSLVLIATIATTAITPFLYSYSDELYRILERVSQSHMPRVYRKYFLNKKMSDANRNELKNHIIICGFGKVGRYVTQAVSFSKEPYVVIDLDANLVQKAESEGHKIIFGDSTNRDVLLSANISKAKVIVITLPKQSINAIPSLVSTVKELNPKAEIIIRGNIDDNEKVNYLEQIIEPEFEAAVGIVNKLSKLQNSSNGTVKKLRNFRKKEIEAMRMEIRD
jgi:CPA2 family monovalent cation:H+ antiporter-2